MADAEHPRLVLHNFMSPDVCKELEFIHKSCSTIGYRPNVFSTTLSHLIATNSAHLIVPFIPIRERLKEKAEEFFQCEYELFIEFTGLISWTKGANIGWHSDDNRPYLKQRDFADVLMYTADSRNIHSVEEITDGERLTLTLWFSRDRSHDEDSKLISLLTESPLNCLGSKFDMYLPLPASNNMYWFPPEQASTYLSGFDIRCARIHVLGYDLYSSADMDFFSAGDASYRISEAPIEPLLLIRGNELFDKEFGNILHVLQVVQFFCWKGPELQRCEINRKTNNVVPISQSQWEIIHGLKVVLLKDEHLAESIFGCASMQCFFDWATFSAAIDLWEAYSSNLRQKLLTSLPSWITHQSILCLPLLDLDDDDEA